MTKQTKSDSHKKVEKMVRQCVKFLKKKEYELNLPPTAIETALAGLIVSEKSNKNWASAHEIHIGLNRWDFHTKNYTEYASFAKDKVIGNITVTDFDDHLMLTVAHEVAHFIQFRYAPYVSRFKFNWRKPHGDVFKQIYRYLRKDLVNPMVEAKFEEVSA